MLKKSKVTGTDILDYLIECKATHLRLSKLATSPSDLLLKKLVKTSLPILKNHLKPKLYSVSSDFEKKQVQTRQNTCIIMNFVYHELPQNKRKFNK